MLPTRTLANTYLSKNRDNYMHWILRLSTAVNFISNLEKDTLISYSNLIYFTHTHLSAICNHRWVMVIAASAFSLLWFSLPTRNNVCTHCWAHCLLSQSSNVPVQNNYFSPPVQTYDTLCFSVSYLAFSNMTFASSQCNKSTTLHFAQFSVAQLRLCVAG